MSKDSKIKKEVAKKHNKATKTKTRKAAPSRENPFASVANKVARLFAIKLLKSLGELIELEDECKTEKAKEKAMMKIVDDLATSYRESALFMWNDNLFKMIERGLLKEDILKKDMFNTNPGLC